MVIKCDGKEFHGTYKGYDFTIRLKSKTTTYEITKKEKLIKKGYVKGHKIIEVADLVEGIINGK